MSGRWRKEKRKARGGFTLMEVLVATLLVTILIGLLLIPIANSVGYFRTATARADAQTVARNALDTMAREIGEAAYVWQDMNDNTMIAFVPALRVDPNDPNSQIVTPPRPDWEHAVRYWRALHNPQYNYSMGTTLAQPNSYFLARTVVEEPFREDDAWNQWNQAWADWMNNPSNPEYDSTISLINWAPLTRVVHVDKDLRPGGGVGTRNATLQPGYPYLEATWTYADDRAQQARFYRDKVVGLTPNAVDYDVPALSFEPMVVSGEWLTPGPDKSTYLAHYPLWRLGVPYRSWTALQTGDHPVFGELAPPEWVHDPFLVIYRYNPTLNPPQYGLVGIGCFDPRSRTMKVIYPIEGVDPNRWPQLYDTWEYPARTANTVTGFDVDWINGSLRFDFPPYHPSANPIVPGRTEERPLEVAGADLTLTTARGGVAVRDYPLAVWWQERIGGQELRSFVLPDSVRIRIDRNGDGLADRALQRVFRAPRDFADEFQAGLDPLEDGAAGRLQPKYGYVRLPAHLADGSATAEVDRFWIYYRWRNNGVVPAGQGLGAEKPDLVSAYYRTGAALDINVTVSRVNPSARGGQQIAQSVHMTRRVKLQNVIREIRDVR